LTAIKEGKMEMKGGSKLSKRLVLSIAALLVWGSAGVSILQFIAGGELLGVLFAIVAVILLVIAVEGSMVERLVGKPASKANMLVFVAVLFLVGINELWGLSLIPVRTGARYPTQLIFTFGLLALIVLTALNAVRLPKSS
jgi:hypothetical protein